MKSNTEMVESILRKAHEKENRMKKTKKITALGLAVVTAVCAAAGTGYFLQKKPAVEPNAAEEAVSTAAEPAAVNETRGLSLLVASAAQAPQEETVTPVEHIAGVRLPITGKLVIENVAGLSEEEKSARHVQLNENLTREWQTSKSCYHVGGAESRDYIGSLAFEGKFVVFADDTHSLEALTVSCGSFGRLMIEPATWNGKMPALSREWFAAFRTGQSITVSAQDYTDIYQNVNVDEKNGAAQPIGMYVNYDISEALLNEKELHPDMGYGQFADEIVFRALYKDGSESSYTVAIAFDESGTLRVNLK